jgi:SSS family solute:Na+ symporter
VFALVNAPLLATFLLGMFWSRTTGHGAFVGLLAGTAAALFHHGVSLSTAAQPGVKGGWLMLLASYPSEMAQNFWTAIWAWLACFAATIAVSLVTRRKPDAQLVGLVYSLTPVPAEHRDLAWYRRPARLGAIVLLAALMLNLVVW